MKTKKTEDSRAEGRRRKVKRVIKSRKGGRRKQKEGAPAKRKQRDSGPKLYSVYARQGHTHAASAPQKGRGGKKTRKRRHK